jgi:hypothetical protein
MPDDSFTEVTSQSCGSRLIESIKGVFVGFIFIVISFPLLFWNEGRAVRRAKTLEEGAAAVISVPADRVDASNEGKLVHMTGEATTAETVSDPEFNVSVPAIKLERYVEMYQWKQESRSETKKKFGGGTETVTTYTYERTWSPQPIDSTSFKVRADHQNPREMPVGSQQWTAKKVTLGAFTLSDAQLLMMKREESYSVDEKDAAALPPAMKKRAQFNDGGYYLGKDPANPAIGDTRVSFKMVRPATVSIVGRQVAGTFEPYQAKAGGSVLLLSYGTLSADSMFKSAEAENVMLTWILRLAGFLLMALGLFLFFRPFQVFADVVPLLGSLLGAGIAIFAGLVAAALTSVTIAISWLVFRPLLGIGLLALAGGAVAALIYLARRMKKPAPSARATSA